MLAVCPKCKIAPGIHVVDEGDPERYLLAAKCRNRQCADFDRMLDFMPVQRPAEEPESGQ